MFVGEELLVYGMRTAMFAMVGHGQSDEMETMRRRKMRDTLE